MKCFYHPQSDAVGICRNCSKGVCRECLVDTGYGIACKGNCEVELKVLNEAISRSKETMRRSSEAYQKTSEAYSRNAIIYLLVGIVFLVFGLFEINKPIAYFLIPSGIIFLLGSGFQYSTAQKFKK